MSITERARGDRAFADIGDWADKELISDVTNKVRAYKRDDVAKKRAGITVTPAEAIEFLKTFAPTRCWGCGVPLTWPGVYSTISGEKRCLRQYSFDRIDDSRAHEASNLIVTCLGCNVLHRLGSGPVACPRGCHSGWPYRAQPITSAAHAKLVKFHQNPEPELSLARSLKRALHSDLYPDSEWADLEDADAVVKTFGISANRPCAPLFRSLKFAGNAIELAFAARHNCLGNLLAAELEGYGFAPPRSGCWGCKEEGEPLGTCRACGVAKYCKKACQVSHWRAGHKTECTDWRNLKERHLPTGERAKPTSAEDLHSFDDANSRVSHYERWLAAKCEEAGDENTHRTPPISIKSSTSFPAQDKSSRMSTAAQLLKLYSDGVIDAEALNVALKSLPAAVAARPP
jgi:hypothetical protein